MEERINALILALESMDDSELIGLWNEYCDECNYADDRIYNMEDMNEICDVEYMVGNNRTTLELIDRIQIDFRRFDTNDDYFFINGYGHYISFNSLEYADEGCPLDCEILAKAIADGDVNIRGYDELNEIVNGDADDEEE